MTADRAAPAPAVTSYANVIAGRTVPARAGRTLDVICPGLAVVPHGGAEDVDAAVQ